MKATPLGSLLPTLALLAPLVAAPGAWADPGSCPAIAVEQARTQYQTLDFSGTIRATRDVENCHDGTVAELVEALRWRAQAHAADGDAAAATRDFSVIATLQPDYVLDQGLSPKLHALHREGRALAERKQLVFARTIVADAGGQPAAVAEISNPTGRSISVAFELKAGGKSARVPAEPMGGNRFRAALPPQARGELSATLHDGERVVFRSAPISAALVAPPQPALVADAPLKPWPPSPPVLEPRAATAADRALAPEPAPGGSGARWGLVVGGAALAAVVIGAIVIFVARPQPLTGTLGRMETQ